MTTALRGVKTEELALPTTGRTALAASIWASLKFAGSFTDLLVHEGHPIRLKSARGLIKLEELNLPGGDLIVTEEHIKQFLAVVDDLEPGASASKHWDLTAKPILERRDAIVRTIKTPGDEFLRLSIFLHHRGRLSMMVRPTLPPRRLEEIGMNSALLQHLKATPRGLFIVTGRPSTGKTVTAYSTLDFLNRHASGHIETVEDPIEYPMQENGCVFTQREVGVDVPSFGDGLRDAMRHTPDVILTGEVRDRDTAEAAILGGESGALMIVTTHGRSIGGTLRKILALCGEQGNALRSMLAGNLIGVMRQELVPHKDGTGYSMVHDTLLGTDFVRSTIEKGDWAALEKVTAQDAPPGPNFVSMRQGISALVAKKTIDLGMASAVVGEAK